MIFVPLLFGWRRKAKPEPAPAAPAPVPPETAEARLYGSHEARILYLEDTLRMHFENEKLRAQRIVTQDARITEQDKLISALQQQNTEQAAFGAKLADSLEKRVKEIGILEGRLHSTERGKEEQGKRLGQLERQIPLYRDYVLKAKMMLLIWRRHLAAIRALCEAAGVVLPPDPELPELPDLEMEHA